MTQLKSKIPGYIQGALVNIIEYDSEMLSECGLRLAERLRDIRDNEEAELKAEAEKLDSLWDNK